VGAGLGVPRGENVKTRRALVLILASIVLLLAVSFGLKWIIFDTVLQPDDSGRQRISVESG